MRKFFTLALVVAAMGAASVGCGSKSSGSSAGGSGGSGGDTGGSTGGSGGTTVTTSSTSSSSSSSTAPDCSGLFPTPTECTDCAAANCCVELTDCQADAECSTCLDGSGDPNACAANAQWTAVNTCAQESCAVECTPASSCNPVTNEGCDSAAGEACDFGNGGTFTCYPAPNDKLLCEACGSADGYCAGGMTCNTTCAKFCCDDGDCGTGTCDKTLTGDANVGLCVDAQQASACDAPIPSPSNGACFTF